MDSTIKLNINFSMTDYLKWIDNRIIEVLISDQVDQSLNALKSSLIENALANVGEI